MPLEVTAANSTSYIENWLVGWFIIWVMYLILLLFCSLVQGIYRKL